MNVDVQIITEIIVPKKSIINLLLITCIVYMVNTIKFNTLSSMNCRTGFLEIFSALLEISFPQKLTNQLET